MEYQHQLKEIFQRYLNNECTPEEVGLLLEHFKDEGNERQLRDIIISKLSEYPPADREHLPQPKLPFNDTFDNIIFKIDAAESVAAEEAAEPATKHSLLIKIITSVAVLLIIFQSVYVYYGSDDNTAIIGNNKVAEIKPKHKAGIHPGSNKATLTLQDGSKIVLNDARNGTLAQQGNAKIIKLANGQVTYNSGDGQAPQKVVYNTMTTPRGGQYKLTLPDGTEVWLNSASSITYPTAFVTNERNVTITGEAYFEVAKDKTKPFHVKAGNQTVEVLGTHFNIMAYADEEAIKTTLLEGSVKVIEKDHQSLLKPGEQAVVDKDGGIKVSPANIDEAMAWKEGYFSFNRVNIKHIMRQLSRWYDVDVTYEGRVNDDEFVGKIGREENISQALRILELDHVHFRIEDKKIIVLP